MAGLSSFFLEAVCTFEGPAADLRSQGGQWRLGRREPWAGAEDGEERGAGEKPGAPGLPVGPGQRGWGEGLGARLWGAGARSLPLTGWVSVTVTGTSARGVALPSIQEEYERMRGEGSGHPGPRKQDGDREAVGSAPRSQDAGRSHGHKGISAEDCIPTTRAPGC